MRSYKLLVLFFITTLVTALAAVPTFAKTITFDSLLGEMVNLSTLADFPSPDYTCKQASSYDRHSVAADKPGDKLTLRVPAKSSGKHDLVVRLTNSFPSYRITPPPHVPNHRELSDARWIAPTIYSGNPSSVLKLMSVWPSYR